MPQISTCGRKAQNPRIAVAIAAVLTDLDAELVLLEQRLAKTRALCAIRQRVLLDRSSN